MNYLDNLPKPFLVLAPMYDVTDTVFRRVVGECAPPDVYFTEFVNVDGLQSPGRSKIIHRLKFTDTEQPLVAQIWGKTPENYRKTAKELVEMGFVGVDINMGCPDKAIVKNGCCGALCDNRDLAAEIIKSTKQGAAGKVPVSVKARLGLKQIDLSWIEFLLKQNLDMLTVHLRTVKEMSAVPAHWDQMAEVVKLRDKISPQTKIVGNGDVLSYKQAQELAQKYNLDGVMIGRGIFQDPYLFAQQSPWPGMAPKEKLALYQKHVELFAKTWKNNERPVVTLNKFCKIYVNGFDGAKELREKLMGAKSADELLKTLKLANTSN